MVFCIFGITLYDLKPTPDVTCLDASLNGLGGCFNNLDALPIPQGFKNYFIVHLEMVNVITALKLWGPLWAKKARIQCDNHGVVDVLNTGRARDSIVASCARNVWLLGAMFNISLTVSHIQVA